MKNIAVSIVYAEKSRQWYKELTVPRGTLARDLVAQSNFLSEVPALMSVTEDDLKLGIYATPVDQTYLLEEGDRLEVYRPLNADPKEVRRQLALMGKTIGNKSK